MIEIDKVTKSYGDRRVVDHLSLTVDAGALCVLLGSSGCGKSTTLRMINRLIPTDSGSIRVGGEDVTRVPAEALRRRIGYAIQSIGLFPHWTVEDNIATVPRLLKWRLAQVRERVTELLELFREVGAADARQPRLRQDSDDVNRVVDRNRRLSRCAGEEDREPSGREGIQLIHGAGPRFLNFPASRRARTARRDRRSAR